MATYQLPSKASRRLAKALAKEAKVPFDRISGDGLHISHWNGIVNVEFKIWYNMSEEHFNDLLRAAQEGECAPVIEGTNAVE